MSLDEPRNWSVAAFLEKEPRDWNRRDWEYVEHMRRECDESPEGEASRWANRMEQAASERPQVHYVTNGPE